MLYRGIEFPLCRALNVIIGRAATVAGTKISGYGRTRDEAIDNAKKGHRPRPPEATLQAGLKLRGSMII
jgi:hypothetical protein